jgi:ZIP family zinc transporter
MLTAFLSSLLAGAATGLGAIPVLVYKNIPHRVYDTLLGFAAGAMLGAISFSLVLPAVEAGGLGQALVGLIAGVALLLLLEVVVPHLEPHFSREPLNLSSRRGLLLALAVTLHNLPEGFSVGVGYASGQAGLGLILALAIGAQNIPEGLAVAFPLRLGGVSRRRSFLFALISGLAEPPAALLGFLLMGWLGAFSAMGLALAAGAMLYVVFNTLIPESHKHGLERESSLGVVAGFLFLLVLQELLA